MLDRRSFVRLGGVAAANALFADILQADPYRPRPRDLMQRRAQPIRVRGIVRGDGRGLANVRVTDGRQVVSTSPDGSYELITSAAHEFITMSVPAGYSIPVSDKGTAQGYAPIRPNGRDEMSVIFDLDRLMTSDEQHTMLLLPDIQTEDPQEMEWFHAQSVPDLMRTVTELRDRPIVGISCGDIMFDDLSLYPEYERGVQRIGVPFVQVVGNHDLDQENGTDEASTATFARHFGPRYRSFDRGAVHYVILDDVFWYGAGYMGYLDENQLTWLANDLQFVEAGRPVIVAAHIPILGTGHVRRGREQPSPNVSVTNRELLYRLLEPYDAHVVCGHTHESDHNYERGIHEHVSGTVCGAWWSGPICADGSPNGYSIYEVNGEHVTWRYKATGEDQSYQIRTYPRGADPAYPNEIVANVWDWDERWNVVWYENGERRGPMTRRLGLDPLSVELHSGPDLPPRRKWVDPYPTNHLFYATVSHDAVNVTVEAEDQFGRTYTRSVPRKS